MGYRTGECPEQLNASKELWHWQREAPGFDTYGRQSPIFLDGPDGHLVANAYFPFLTVIFALLNFAAMSLDSRASQVPSSVLAQMAAPMSPPIVTGQLSSQFCCVDPHNTRLDDAPLLRRHTACCSRILRPSDAASICGSIG